MSLLEAVTHCPLVAPGEVARTLQGSRVLSGRAATLPLGLLHRLAVRSKANSVSVSVFECLLVEVLVLSFYIMKKQARCQLQYFSVYLLSTDLGPGLQGRMQSGGPTASGDQQGGGRKVVRTALCPK